MSIVTIDMTKKVISLDIPYEGAKDLADVLEIAQDANDARAHALEMAEIKPEVTADEAGHQVST